MPYLLSPINILQQESPAPYKYHYKLPSGPFLKARCPSPVQSYWPLTAECRWSNCTPDTLGSDGLNALQMPELQTADGLNALQNADNLAAEGLTALQIP